MPGYPGFVALFGVASPFQAVKNQVKPKTELLGEAVTRLQDMPGSSSGS